MLETHLKLPIYQDDFIRRRLLTEILEMINDISKEKNIVITDEFVDAVLIDYGRLLNKYISDCPNTEVNNWVINDYKNKLKILSEYTFIATNEIDEIVNMIMYWGICNAVSITSGHKEILLENAMPFLEKEGCNMEAAEIALEIAMSRGDAMIEAQLNGTGDN